MNTYTELTVALDRLKRNETQMTPAQKTQFASQLKALKQNIYSLALEAAWEFLFTEMFVKDNCEKMHCEVIKCIASDSTKAEIKRALKVLYDTYDAVEYLTLLEPLYIRIMHEIYAPYWLAHCKKVKRGDTFTYYNDLIDMYWHEEARLWLSKDQISARVILPPTSEAIKESFSREVAAHTKNTPRAKNTSHTKSTPHTKGE